VTGNSLGKMNNRRTGAAAMGVGGRDVETLAGLNQLLESRDPVAKACAGVQTCLGANKDNLRGFFEQCFPLLLTKIFGYGGGSVSWLSAVAQPGKEHDAAMLVQLLSPKGVLLSAMHSADSDHIIRFILPRERLPSRTQLLLRSEEGVRELQQWPQYVNSIVKDPKLGQYQIQVSVFNYFLFWFAFYAMGKHGTAGRMDSGRYGGRVGRNIGAMKTWVSDAREQLFQSAQGGRAANPYPAILQDYLDHFLPHTPDAQPSGNKGSGVVVLGVLIEFWLTFSDDESTAAPAAVNPLTPNSQTRAARRLAAAGMMAQAGQPGTPTQTSFIRQRAYQPPSDDLVEAITRLVVHLTCRNSAAGGGGLSPAHLGQLTWLPPVPMLEAQLPMPPSLPGQYLGMAGGRPFQTLLRYVYRFIRVSIARNSVEQSGSMRKLLELWRAAALPWTSRPLPRPVAPSHVQSPPLKQITSHLPHLLHMNSPPAAQQAPALQRFSSEWRSHTLATLPFMNVLLPLLIEATVSRVLYSPQPLEPLKDLLAAFQPLSDSPDLVALLKAVDASLAHFHSNHHRTTEAAYAEVLPFLCDQALDWEKVALAGVDVSARPNMAVSTAQPLFGVEPGSAACNMAVLLQLEKPQAMEGGRKLLQQMRTAALRVLPLDDIPVNRPRSPVLQDFAEPNRHQLRKSKWEDLQVQVSRQKGNAKTWLPSIETSCRWLTCVVVLKPGYDFWGSGP